METNLTEDRLLTAEPDLYEFEKKCDFFQSKTKHSFILSAPIDYRIKSNSFRISPKLISQNENPISPPKETPNENDELISNENINNNNDNNEISLVNPEQEDYQGDSPIKEDENEQDEDEENTDEDENYSDISSVIIEEDENNEEEEEEDLNLETEKPLINPDADNQSFQQDDVIEKEKNIEKQETNKLNESDEEIHDYELEMALDLITKNENLLNETEKLRYSDKYKHIRFIIYPDDYFRNLWDVVLILVLMYTCIIMPYRIGFLSNYDSTIQWTIVDWTTDSIFYGDILVNFLSAYYDFEEELVVSRKKICLNYITGWFFFDIAGVMPFDQFFDVSRYGNLVRVSRLPRLYKLMRLTRLLRLLKIVKERNKILRKVLDILQISAGFERIFLSFLSILLFCHIMACFWYMAADLNDQQDNWIVVFNYVDRSNTECYIVAFYYVVQTVVTVGYGDIYSGNTIERTFTCCLMFIGVFFYSFTIGSLSSLLSNLDSKSAHLEKKLNTLIQLKSQYNLDDELYLRLKRGVKYGLSKYNFDKIEFLDNLPMNLRVELSVIMHKNLVKGIEFFQNKPARFIAFIGPYLKLVRHGKDEIVYSEGEYADEMFFLKQGSVSVVLKEFNNFEILNIEKGYYFGEVDLLFGETRKVTIMANEELELLSLNKKNFTKIFFHEFREIGSEIYKNALKRKIRVLKIYKEAVEYCKKENIGANHSFTQRSSLFRKKKNSFQAQISMPKEFQSSLKESEVFTPSNKLSNKEFPSIPRLTGEITKKFDRHLTGNLTHFKTTQNEKDLEKRFSLASSNNNNSNKDDILKNFENINQKKRELNVEINRNKKGGYYEKFTSMLAKTPLITKNYIPFDLDLSDSNLRNVNESIKKVDELQEKITKMDKNMEDILKVFNELGMAFKKD